MNRQIFKTIAEELLELTKEDYRMAKDVYDLLDVELFLDSPQFLVYCEVAEVDPDIKAREIRNVLPSARVFKSVPIGRIANLMHYSIADAIVWCVKTGNCKSKKGKLKTVNYKQAKRLVRHIRKEREE